MYEYQRLWGGNSHVSSTTSPKSFGLYKLKQFSIPISLCFLAFCYYYYHYHYSAEFSTAVSSKTERRSEEVLNTIKYNEFNRKRFDANFWKLSLKQTSGTQNDSSAENISVVIDIREGLDTNEVDASQLELLQEALGRAKFQVRLVCADGLQLTIPVLSKPLFVIDCLKYELDLTSALEEGKSLLIADWSSSQVDPNTKSIGNRIQIQVKLELGYFPMKFCSGNVCDPANLLFQDHIEWSGREILDEKFNKIYINLPKSEKLDNDSISSAGCTSVLSTPLIGGWVGEEYKLLSASCKSLPNIHIKSTCSNKDGNPSVCWQKFIGDSNTREFFTRYMRKLKIYNCKFKTSSGYKYPTEIICANEKLISTFNWWFQGYEPENDFEKLSRILSIDLYSFVTLNGFDGISKDLQSLKNVSEHRIYLSFGSHAPFLQISSFHDVLFERYSTVLIPKKSSLRLVLTTATNATAIPAKFGNQAVLQNNVRIDEFNNETRQFAKLYQLQWLDLFTPTIAIENPPWFRINDAVHFNEIVYFAWAKIYSFDLNQQSSKKT